MDIQAYINSGIIERYALGLASPEEMKELESLVTLHREIRDELDTVQASLEEYSRQYAQPPPAYLKERVMNKIRENISVQKESQTVGTKFVSMQTQSSILPAKNTYRYAAAAVVVLLLSSMALNYVFYIKWKTSEKELTQLDAEKSSVAAQFQIQKTNYQQALQDLRILKDPLIARMELKSMMPALKAQAVVFKDSRTNELFLDIKKLPAPPDSMQYQFWAIVQGKPVDAGMITLCPPTDTCNIHKMNTVPDAQAFAISLEKKGGNSQPKGQIYLAYGI
jgi:anti-sigma-K factor RskA